MFKYLFILVAFLLIIWLIPFLIGRFVNRFFIRDSVKLFCNSAVLAGEDWNCMTLSSGITKYSRLSFKIIINDSSKKVSLQTNDFAMNNLNKGERLLVFKTIDKIHAQKMCKVILDDIDTRY